MRAAAWAGGSRRTLLWSALALVGALAAVAVLRDEAPPAPDPTLGAVVRVGVAEGESIPDYLRDSRAELAALSATGDTTGVETYALVSFVAYLSPDRLASVLAEVPVAEVVARVPLPGVQTEIVRIPAMRLPDDVVAGLMRVAERKEREARDYRERAVAAEDARHRRLFQDNAGVAAGEAAAYRSSCACVYAAVVRAAPPVLARLAEAPEVRTVDPAPAVRRLDRTVLLPPLPEQEDVVRPPRDERLDDDRADS
ncbi:MAG TPA: hypothetical protein VF174_11410 [Micromonosporaceae bacterium]